MRIIKILFLLIISNSLYSQGVKIEMELNLVKDTIEILEKIEYSIHLKNITKDTIKISKFQWQDYHKPGLEIRIDKNSTWETLWKSDVDLIDECILKLREDCYSKPIERFECVTNYRIRKNGSLKEFVT